MHFKYAAEITLCYQHRNQLKLVQDFGSLIRFLSDLDDKLIIVIRICDKSTNGLVSEQKNNRLFW